MRQVVTNAPSTARPTPVIPALRQAQGEPGFALAGMTMLLAGLAFSSPVLAAPQLACHYTYGGETKNLLTPRHEAAARYTLEPLAIGSYFLFRPVFEPGAVKLYTWVDHPDGPALVHQATYPHPAATRSRGRYGFTGEQRVYEPVRDSELEYWCEIQHPREGK